MKTDYIFFSLLLIGTYVLIEVWMWRRTRSADIRGEDRRAVRNTLPVLMGALLMVLLSVGWFFVEQAERVERERIERIVKGIAPTLAYELSTEGHARIQTSTAPDDPLYLELIGFMVHWMRLNREIESIYTMRQRPDGSLFFVMGPETDYDRNGVIEGEEEQRVPIGEVYEEKVPELDEAFDGKNTIQKEPTLDKWGYSISAFVPVYDLSGKQEAVLGVDFNGATWVQGIRMGRLNVMGVMTIFFILMNATYLIVINYREEALRIKRHQAELARSKEEADTANRAKSEFLSRMSHDLRTPLNAVSGFAQLLESDPALSETHRGMVREILSASDHLLQLINEVLDLARIEAGRISLAFDFVPVCSVIGNCVTLTQALAAKRGIGIAADMKACEGYLVHADPTRLQEVILNFMSNAVKYNREGGAVTIAAEPVADGYLRISVTDTGHGIPPEELETIFEPFTRLKAHKDVEGTGIGLTIVKKIVELMGGRIGVTSTVGEGSCFWMEMPCVKGNGESAAAPGRAMAAAAFADSGRHYNVLYIEDTSANVALMANIFARFPSVTMHSAPTGELGIEMAQAERPDLILTDINLPGIDGFEVLRRLRGLETTRRIPVIAVSSNARPEDIERGKTSGFADYLTKPINVAEFVASVNAALGAR